MSILDQSIRVDREAERISVFNGSASLDFNGNEQLRREAMRFYEQAPRAFRVLGRLVRATLRTGELDADEVAAAQAEAEAVLRDAGVI